MRSGWQRKIGAQDGWENLRLFYKCWKKEGKDEKGDRRSVFKKKQTPVVRAGEHRDAAADVLYQIAYVCFRADSIQQSPQTLNLP